MKLTEKIAYMKGLLDDMELDTTTKEGKAISQMADVMEEMAIYIDDLQSQVDELTELCDIIDEDLGNVESDLYCDEDDEDDDDFDDDEDEDYPLGSVLDPDDYELLDDEDDEDEPQYEVKCPSCGDSIIIGECMLEEGSMICPGCGEVLEFDYDNIIPDVSDDEDEDDADEN